MDAVFERVPTIVEDLIQVLRLVRELQVELLPQVMGVVEFKDLGATVVGLLDILHQDVMHLLQELDRDTAGSLAWEKVCGGRGRGSQEIG